MSAKSLCVDRQARSATLAHVAGYQLKSCAMAPLFALDCEPIPGLTYQLLQLFLEA